MKFQSLLAVAILFLTSNSFGHAKDAFEKFKEEPLNKKGSHRRIADPTGEAPSPKVDSFSIVPGKCKGRDCSSNSVRSQVFEPAPFQKQPKEAWYGWNMYFPANFPIGPEQAATGLYSFAYWHNADCPHLGIVSDTGFGTKLRLQTMTGSDECAPDTMIQIGDLKELRGKWLRFQVHTKWSTGDDGMTEVYLNGDQVASFKGRTLSVENPKRNFFKYGVYLCCTKGVELVTPATVLYTGVARSDTREGLN